MGPFFLHFGGLLKRRTWFREGKRVTVGGPQERNRRRKVTLQLESLEGRICLTSYPLSLVAFQSLPAGTTSSTQTFTVGGNPVTVKFTGYVDNAVDPRLTAIGALSNVLAVGPPGSPAGTTGTLALRGALGIDATFNYGIHAGVDNRSIGIGGFTGYTSSVTGAAASPQQPGGIFAQFSVGAGTPHGPTTIQARSDGTGHAGNPGYYNTFNWTASGDPFDVHDTSVRGLTQVDHVLLDVEPVNDILANSVTVTPSGPAIDATFAPMGVKKAVQLKDLAYALSVPGKYTIDHFNWLQHIIRYPGHWAWQIESASMGQGINTMKLPKGAAILDPVHNYPTNQLQFIDTNPTTKVQTLVTIVDSSGISDNADPYWDTGTDVQKHTTATTLTFHDQPTTGQGTLYPGDKLVVFKTELVGVDKNENVVKSWSNLDTNFLWQSDGYNVSPNTAFFGGGGTPPTVPVIGGGVSGVVMDAPGVPDTPPATRPDAAVTSINVPVTIPVLANDIDTGFGNIDPTTVQVTVAPSHGNVAVDPVTGDVTYTPNAGFVGIDTFRYTVMDDRGTVSNESPVTVLVNDPSAAATATTTAFASATQSASDQSVTLNAKVVSAGGTVNGGTVTFSVYDFNGNQIGSTVSGAVSGGVATAAFTLAGGTAADDYSILAVYNGTAAFQASIASNNTLTVSATAAALTGTITARASATQSASDQSVTLSGKVVSTAGTVNGGTVTFTVYNGSGVQVGTPVSGGVVGGVATAPFTLPGGTAAGSYSILAAYNGTPSFQGSSAVAAPLIVNALGAASTTIVTANASAPFSVSDQTVSLSANLSSVGGTVNEGTVTFTVFDAHGNQIQ
jgi:hypothetical protein